MKLLNKCGLDSGTDPDKTPFLQELVNDGGKTYYHLIIGLPKQAFVQETFISTGGGSFTGTDGASNTAGTITSTLTLADPQAAPGNFDSTKPGATPGAHVTAGRYTYVTGSGSSGYGSGFGGGSGSGFGGSFGDTGSSSSSPATYLYVESANSFNPNTVDWQAFRDASQNFGLPQAGNSGKSISGGGGGGFGGF